MRKLLVTSALPYANGSIHLGHLVEYIQTDIWVRFQKMSGNETYYICADDTHGTPIMLKAEEENISPDDLVSKVHDEHANDFKEFNVNFDHFYSTNSPENKKLSESIYNTLKENNKISSKEIDQFYDESKAMFYLTGLLRARVLNAKQRINMGIHVKNAGRLIAQQT